MCAFSKCPPYTVDIYSTDNLSINYHYSYQFYKKNCLYISVMCVCNVFVILTSNRIHTVVKRCQMTWQVWLICSLPQRQPLETSGRQVRQSNQKSSGRRAGDDRLTAGHRHVGNMQTCFRQADRLRQKGYIDDVQILEKLCNFKSARL